MGDGQVERYNRTLLDMLGTLSAKEKHDWKEQVAPIVHAYNYTRNSSTGDSPFHLMYRRQPRLPVDLALGVQEEVQAEEKSYRSSLHEGVEGQTCRSIQISIFSRSEAAR